MTENLAVLAEITLSGSACILLLLASGPLLSKKFSPRWRYRAWLVLAVVLVAYPGLQPAWERLIPAPIQLPVPQVVEDNAYDRYSAYDQDWQRVQAAGSGSGGGASRTILSGEQEWSRHHVHYENESGEEVFIEDNDFLRTVTVGEETTYTVHWTGVAMGAYYAAVLLSIVLVLARCRGSRRRLLRRSRPADEDDRTALEEARRRVDCKREAALYRCPGLRAPVQMGIWHPVILLPETLPEGSREAALDHELTHLKRGDVGYLAFLTLARCFHWFNPLVWLMVRAARRDMELCCDWDLLRGRDEEARRAYGRAILDQMTGRDRSFSGLTTGFSGSKREVFARFRAMMDQSPRKKGGAVLALAAAAIVLSGSLVSCQTSGPPPAEEPVDDPSRAVLGHWAWIESVDLEDRNVTYIPMTPEQWDDPEGFWAEMGELERETAPLWENVALLHSYEGETYSLNPTTLQHTLGMSQAGLRGYVLVNRDGEAVEICLERASQLDLSAADLDFTGYCGYVYAAGGVDMLGTLSWNDTDVWVDPCSEIGPDGDHTVYRLPRAEGCVIQEGLSAYTSGLSSGHYPDLYRLTVVDGAVTAAEGIWAEAEP